MTYFEYFEIAKVFKYVKRPKIPNKIRCIYSLGLANHMLPTFSTHISNNNTCYHMLPRAEIIRHYRVFY